MSLSDKKIGREIPYEIDKYCYYEKDVREAIKELKEKLDSGLFTTGYIHTTIKKIFGEELCT
ncbi:MAG TPA: hypothetical protein V6C58_04640 [Allocoleopsis sp.]